MTDTKISELPDATSIDSPDLVPIVQSGATKKATISLFQSFLKFIGLDFTGNDLQFLNGIPFWKSTGDSNDPGTHPYSPLTSGIIVKDANNEEVFRIWGSDPNEDNDNSDNLFIGKKAGLTNTDGFFNTGVGALSLSALTGNLSNLNTAVGVYSLPSLTVAQENTAIGASAGTSAITSNSMVFIGSASDQSSNIALNNGIAIGADSRVETSLTAVIGSVSQTDVYFGSTAGNSIIHGKGDAIVFPDSDPHVAGAAYWVLGVLTKSAG